MVRPEVRILRKGVYEFLHEEIFPIELEGPVLEIGPMDWRWTPIKDYFVDTRSFFENKGLYYMSCDTDPDAKPDLLCDVLDLQAYLAPTSIGTIICLEVIEHVSKVWLTPQLFAAILKDRGRLFLSTPFMFYRHAPFPDYWRLTEDGLRFLFEPYFDLEISSQLREADVREPLHYRVKGIKR